MPGVRRIGPDRLTRARGRVQAQVGVTDRFSAVDTGFRATQGSEL